MKRKLLYTTLACLIMILSANFSYAQPPHPAGNSGHGSNQNQPGQAGGGAPIDGGISIYLISAFAYLAIKKGLLVKEKLFKTK